MSLPTIGSMLDASGSFAKGQSIAQQSINQRLQRDEADQIRALRERQVSLQEQEAIQKFQAQQAEQKLIEESFNKPEEVLPLVYARDPNKAKAIADQIQNTYQQKYQTANLLLKTDAQNKQFYYERALPELQQAFPNIQFGDKFSPEIQKQLKREADFVKAKINTVYSLQETARGIENYNNMTGDLIATGQRTAPSYSTIDTGDKIVGFDSKTGNVKDLGLTKIDKTQREEIKKEEKAIKGAEKIDNLAKNLADNFNKLKEVGGIQSAGEGFNPMEIPFAQGIAKVANTKAQSYRNKINSQKQAAKFAIMEATGMSAKAVDSNQEAKAILDSIGSEVGDYDSAIFAVQEFANRYGTGNFKVNSLNQDKVRQSKPSGQIKFLGFE
jgi:hypothetical protein